VAFFNSVPLWITRVRHHSCIVFVFLLAPVSIVSVSPRSTPHITITVPSLAAATAFCHQPEFFLRPSCTASQQQRNLPGFNVVHSDVIRTTLSDDTAEVVRYRSGIRQQLKYYICAFDSILRYVVAPDDCTLLDCKMDVILSALWMHKILNG